MKKIIAIFKYNISLKIKLICSYLIIVTIPLSLLGAVLYSYYLDAFIKQSSESANQLTRQINKNIESYFAQIDELSINIAYDDTVNSLLDDLHYNSKFSDSMDEQILNDLLSRYLLSKAGVDSIHLYADEHFIHAYKRGTINEHYRPMTQDYLKRIVSSYGKSYILSRNENQFVESYFTISLVRPILSLYSFKTVGVLVIDVNYGVLKDLINEVNADNCMIFILNEKDQILYSEDSSAIGKRMTQDLYYNKRYEDGLINVYDENNQKYLFISQRSSITSHRIVIMTPYSNLAQNVNESSIFIIEIGVFLFIIAFIIGLVITNTITKPIRELQHAFNDVGKSNFVGKKITGKNEISELWMGFNKMGARIDELIAEIIKKENQKRKAKINALQMQINPHFLYNTLNSIKYLAMIQSAQNISRITDLLIFLLKDLSNTQTDFNSIKDEIGIVMKYMEIQKAIYFDKFSVSVICPEELFEIKILKFLLQPIIENSIFHGILPSEKKGQIRIKIIQGETLQIKIIDNGIGMDAHYDFLNEGINEDEGNHIGLRNINHRIKLFYGEEYGLIVRSAKNIGTIVIINLPILSDV